MFEYFFIALALVLLGYVFYQQVIAFQWDSLEVNRLEQIELQLAHILRLLDAPDVRYLMTKRKSRKYLFMEFSECLRKDIVQLLRFQELSFASVGLVGVFFAFYYLMRAKALLFCGPKDLHFLSGLELAVFRSIQQ